jgi:Flp pilus assembly pilin Flp
MESIIRSYLYAREKITRLGRTAPMARLVRGQSGARFTRGQTMTEYALILAAVAIAVFVTYQTMGTNIQALVNAVDSKLAGATST